jgi:formate dehydrogenase major subunit
MVKEGDIGYVLPNIPDEVYRKKLGLKDNAEVSVSMKLKAYNDGVVGMSDTGCVSCGNCVSVCPVGALMPKSENEFRDWETKKVVTTCTYCGVGCQIEYSVKDGKIVDAKPANGPSNQGLLCVKGKFAYDFVNHKDRLVHPMIRKNGKHSPLVQVSWEEALDFAANKIKEIRDTYGPDSIAGFSSARTINEDNYLFQKMLRAAIGTNNVDHCARL